MPDRPSISRSAEIDAPPERVFALVSDLPGMGALSPENTGGRWLGGATAPAAGVRFRGSNRHGWRRWSTVVRVTGCEPPVRFAFDVASLGLAVSRWSYEIAPRAGGCTVTETWSDRRGRAMDLIGLLASGVGDRSAYTAQSIEHTLTALKRTAEQEPAPAG
jgi:Polyketide cyclase / dehydrase and lipid transport